MRILTLKRISSKSATCGVLLDDGIPFAVTLERVWANNEPRVSCIPEASYICRRVASPKFGDTFEVTGVEGRSHILLHWGNVTEDTIGCIIVAEKFGTLKNEIAVLESHQPNEGFNELMARLKDENEFMLIILECV